MTLPRPCLLPSRYWPRSNAALMSLESFSGFASRGPCEYAAFPITSVTRWAAEAGRASAAATKSPAMHGRIIDLDMVMSSRATPRAFRNHRPRRATGRRAEAWRLHVSQTTEWTNPAGASTRSGRPPSQDPTTPGAGPASRAGERKSLAGSGTADGVPGGRRRRRSPSPARRRRHHDDSDGDARQHRGDVPGSFLRHRPRRRQIPRRAVQGPGRRRHPPLARRGAGEGQGPAGEARHRHAGGGEGDAAHPHRDHRLHGPAHPRRSTAVGESGDRVGNDRKFPIRSDPKFLTSGLSLEAHRAALLAKPTEREAVRECTNGRPGCC